MRLKVKPNEERNPYLEMEVGLLKKVSGNQASKPMIRLGRPLDKLQVIKALYDGSIVAYHISQNNDYALVMENLRKAMAAKPEATPLIHNDRGS